MTTRDLTDIVKHADGTPWIEAEVRFKLLKGSYTASVAYPRDLVTVRTGVDGKYTATLWCDEEGIIPVQYEVTYPDGAKWKIDLPVGDGSTVLMSTLRAAAPAIPAVSLQTYVDLALAALTLGFQLDGGGPSSIYGGTAPIDGGVA